MVSQRRKLELGAYIVATALAVPCFVLGLLVKVPSLSDLLINLAATFAGAGFLFFLLNRFFGLNDPEQASELSRSSRGYGEINEFRTSGAWADALAARINHAQRVDDVSWSELKALQFRWSQEDREAHDRCDAAVSRVIRNPKVAWREICMFFPSDKGRFEYERKNLLNLKAIGYSVSYFGIPSVEAPPRIGGFTVIDAGTTSAEVFCANSDSTMWFRVRNPIIVDYYTRYFDDLWGRAVWLKAGPKLNEEAFQQLESGNK